MGARYVWGKYTVGTKYKEGTNGTVTSVYGDNSNFYLGTAYTFSADTGLYTLQNAILLERSTPAKTYRHCIPGSKSGATLYSYTGRYDYNWSEQHIGDSRPYIFVADGGDGASLTRRISATEQIPGEKIGDISSTSSGAFPQNGVQGSNWYTYQGQDNIDPSAVSIPAAIASGQQITITVTPGSGKVYGGTVSYQYQVKLDSGAWQTVATTTATTQTYTVPAGTQSIQARVVASDNMGFTSDTYVASAAVTVVGTPASITVPGAAMVGQNFSVSWEAVFGAETYKLERNTGSGWTQVYEGANLTYTDTAGSWTSVQYRVSAGIGTVYGTPLESDTVDIIPASALVISGTDGSLGTITAPVTYSVTSDTGNQITVEETVGNHTRTLTPTSGQLIAIPVSMIDPAADGSGTIVIKASVQASSGQVNQTRSWTYTKTPLTLPTKAYRVEQFQGEAKDVMPLTLAEAVMMPDGVSAAKKISDNERNISELNTTTAHIGVVGQYVGVTGVKSVTIEYEEKPKILCIIPESLGNTHLQLSANISIPGDTNVVFYNDNGQKYSLTLDWGSDQVEITDSGTGFTTHSIPYRYYLGY